MPKCGSLSELNEPNEKKGRTPKFDIFVPTRRKPELGLEPRAVDVIASLFRSVSEHAQVLVSTLPVHPSITSSRTIS